MKKLFILFLALLPFFQHSYSQAYSFHSHRLEAINGDTIDFSKYYRKKVMVVNTASFCSYTPQYALLQDLYEQYKQYNFEIIGFPCNDFGNQDPGSDSTINQFCQNYNVTFQMMSKVNVISNPIDQIYKWLQQKPLNGVANVTVDWNFNKFLIDESGRWVRHLRSPVSPLDTSITNWIMKPSALPLEAFIRADKPAGCYGDTIRLTTEVFGQTFPNPALNYSWGFTGKGQLIQNNGSALFILGDSSDVSVNVTVTEGSKTSTPVFTLLNTGFNLGVEAVPNTIDCNQEAVITVSTSGSANGQSGQTFAWNTSPDNASTITVSQPGTYIVTVSNGFGCSRTASVEVSSICITGISEASASDIQLFPNPASTYFQLQLPETPQIGSHFQLYDAFGRLVKQERLSTVSSTIYRDTLGPGIYFWQVKNAGGILGKGKISLF